ncbi:uncharacterized protein F4822DRAFT_260169 [Hypoxylon trugodes]|uniref:uncharacterized protein n=1 Tax=Hypoxylon trugodes TaxID=326681 RepID=UPI002190EBFF|nr:uncharacterized protein F4822DRAFT_260169 [Hypoxylon trugodes]KAI1388848.1 hypothetical protein F4822DRAFT_260169 [Hypoxylon trugodes]
MAGRHFHGHGHSHAHQHFHSKPNHLEIEQPDQLKAREAMGNLGSEGVNAATRLIARENNLDEKPVGSSTTVPIVLGVCIPLGIAFLILIYLHRRTTIRQRREDETDKYKSMDFGFEGNVATKGNKRRSAFFGKEKEPGHKMQLSMDMNLSSPYLLPPNLHQSRESMHSLARSLHQNEDPYRPVTSYAGSDVGSLRSFQKGGNRESSLYTSKTRTSGDRDSSRNTPTLNTANNLPPRQKSLPSSPLQELAPVAQPPSRRESAEEMPPLPAKNEFRFVDDSSTLPHVPEIQEPPAAAGQALSKEPIATSRPLSEESGNVAGHGDSMALPEFEFQPETDGLGIMGPRASQNSADVSLRDSNTVPASVRPPRKESLPVGSNFAQDYQDYAAHYDVDAPVQHEQEYPHSAGLGVPEQENRRLSVGFRPLPPEDFLESEDPEFRANRIRSFYKEYFEDTKVVDHGKPPPIPQQATYYEDYDAGYLGDGAFFDPDTNAFVMPYAQPVTRRAMTPPPNSRRPMPGPGQRGPRGPHGPHGSMNMPGPRGRPRAGSTMSANRWAPMSPRPDSSASNPRFMGGKPKKPMPPPAPLNTLPTPSKLRDDSFALMGAVEFAPPPTFKDVTAGRSQSPIGERKPYMLNTPIHSPLVSAFDDTPALPSPHLLRKSGTFTALDFAPPRRFKDPDAMSDSGSVVSNRSGISSANLSAIRNGAGRVSRLPGDTVFTQASMNNTLKPSWNMRD